MYSLQRVPCRNISFSLPLFATTFGIQKLFGTLCDLASLWKLNFNVFSKIDCNFIRKLEIFLIVIFDLATLKVIFGLERGDDEFHLETDNLLICITDFVL